MINLTNVKHLVLDLDETLVYRDGAPQVTIARWNCTCEHIPATQQTPFYSVYMYFRPGLISFLQRCIAHFETVSIWTAAQKSWLDTFLRTLDEHDPTLRSRLYFKWNWAHRTVHYNIISGKHKGQQLEFAKDLSTMCATKEAIEVGMTLDNVLLVDDSKYEKNVNPNNALQIVAWNNVRNQGDRELSKLLTLLQVP